MPTSLYVTSILLTFLLTGFLAWYAWRQPPLPGVRAYAGMALSECLLALAESLSLLGGSAAQAEFWFKVRFLFTATIPVFFLVFALEHNGRRDWLSKRLLAGLFSLPLITQLMLWSNPWHGWWLKQEVAFRPTGPFWIAETSARIPGLWFMVHNFYSILLMLAGVGILLFAAWGRRERQLGQALLLSTGALVGLGVGLIPIFNLLPQAEFNPFTPGIGLSELFYALAIFRFGFLKRSSAPETSPRLTSFEPQARQSLALLVFLFTLFVSSLSAVSYLTYQNYQRQFRAQVEAQMTSIVEVKTEQLENWRAERLGDAETLRQNPVFAALVQAYFRQPEEGQTRAQLQAWLDSFQNTGQYDNIILLDAQGQVRLASPVETSRLVPEHMLKDTAECLASRQIRFVDLHLDAPENKIHLLFLVPIYAPDPPGQALGVVALRVSPETSLYSFLRQWPVPSQSAETLLVRRDGESVLYLNPARFEPEAALNLRVPLTEVNVLAVKAALGQTGVVEGLDYRGQPVLGVLAPVHGTPWFLVARMDLTEVYAPLRERLWQTLVFFGALLLAAGAGLVLIWRQQRLEFYRGQVAAAEVLRESEEKFRLAFDTSPDSVAITRLSDGRFVSVNQGFEQITGYTREEVIGKTPLEITIWKDPEDRRKIVAGLQARGEVRNYGAPFLTRDGEIYGLMSAIILQLDGEPHILSITRDVTELKLAEEALRESEELFRQVYEYMEVGVARVSLDFQIQSANEAYCRMLGYSEAELVGKHLGDITHPEILEENLRKQAQLAAGEVDHYRMEKRFVHKDGRVVYGILDSSLIHDAQGEPSYFLSSVLDITERKQAEQEILVAQTELRRLLAAADQSRHALLSVAEDQKEVEAALRESNRRIQHHAEELAVIYDAARKLQWLYSPDMLAQELITLLEDTLHYEYSAILLIDEASGELSPFAISDQGHGPDFVQADKTYIASHHLTVGQGITGYVAQTGQAVRLGDVRRDLRYYAMRDDIRSELCVPLGAEGRIIGVLNVETPTPDAYTESDQRVLETIASQMALAIQQAQLHEQIQHHAAELEERVRDRTAQLAAANQELEAFAYSVSHDLRAPLRALDGFSAALLSRYAGALDEQGRHYLERIQQASQRMGQLINDLLNLSRVTRADLTRQPVDLAALAREVAAELRQRDPQRQAEFTIAAQLETEGDPRLLRIALQNLLENAWKFTGNRPLARIEVGRIADFGFEIADLPGASKSEIRNPKSEIYYVRDNGVGFDMAYADKLFAPFQRLHGMYEFPGTGIGLVTVQRIITRHGGHVWTEAAVDKGAAFFFTLGGIQ